MDTTAFKKKLEDEKVLLERELEALGSRNPTNPSDWMPSKPAEDEFGADRNDNADIIEDMQDNNASLNELEGRLNTVIEALDRMDAGTYGICTECGEEIEQDRLKANPAASTCKTHMSD